jgi:nucleotide-binding universal stress UspA family protein
MKTDTISPENASRTRNILIAVDNSENARRAVQYVAELLRGLPWFRIALLTIISQPPEDYFTDKQEQQKWIADQNAATDNMLEEYRKILIQSGFQENAVDVKRAMAFCPSIADCILNEQKALKSDTLVLGRRGISKKEEFMFGSTSNKLLHSAKDCSIWVIE